MKLYVTSIEPPGPEDGQELPVVHFEGESMSIDASMDENANSGIRGEFPCPQQPRFALLEHPLSMRAPAELKLNMSLNQKAVLG